MLSRANLPCSSVVNSVPAYAMLTPASGFPVPFSITRPVSAPLQTGTSPKSTCSVLAVECVRPPPVPVTVICTGPTVALLTADRLSRAIPEGVTTGGANVAVTPLGNPLTLSVTGRPNPRTEPRVTTKLAVPPGARTCDVGPVTMVKSDGNVSTTSGRTTDSGPPGLVTVRVTDTMPASV